MAPTLRTKTVNNQSGQASKTVDNQAREGPSTAPAINTPDTANSGKGAAAKAGKPNDDDNNDEVATAHNQEVIDRQQQQIRRVRQEIEYADNKRELEKLNARL